MYTTTIIIEFTSARGKLIPQSPYKDTYMLKKEIPPITQEDVSRFYACLQVDQQTGCWNWFGSLNKGYGVIGWGYRGNMRQMSTHRFAYITHVGPIPKELIVHHKCENKRCCNPEHLGAVTQKQNSIYYHDRIKRCIPLILG